MIRAEFICICGFAFTEILHENEVSKTEDFERFYVRCPRCGEEASLRSWEGRRGKPGGEKRTIPDALARIP